MPEEEEGYMNMEDKEARDAPKKDDEINESKVAPESQRGESVPAGTNAGDADAPPTSGEDSVSSPGGTSPDTGGGSSQGGGTGN